MTQQEIDRYFEEKNLVFKDLCGRIPYHVRVQLNDNAYPDPFGAHNLEHFWGYTIVKPYLFPLSSMTEEQKQEYTYIVNYISSDDTENWKEGEFIYVEQFTQLMHFYHINHLDYMGLIPMELAIDATGLNIY